MAKSNAAPAQAQGSPIMANNNARTLILRGGQVGNAYFPPAIDVWQPLNPPLPSTVSPGTVLTFNPRNVGLIKRLVVRIKATVTAGATSTQTLTKLGLQNLISNISFFDLGNNQRINTTGWHLNLISTAKRRRVFGAAYTTDTPNGYGNNNNRLMYAPSTGRANVSTMGPIFACRSARSP